MRALQEVTRRQDISDLARLPEQGELVGYFGYGSLVNRATLSSDVVAAIPARLKNWRRTWRPRPDMDPGLVPAGFKPLPGGLTPSLLSAHPEEGSAIDGLLVIDRVDNLPAVDTREFRYHRRDITLADLEVDVSVTTRLEQLDIRLHVYEARLEHPPVQSHSPILQSYLDTVLKGFFDEFGIDGVHRFVAETDAFHTPIHEDRHQPLYPRAVAASHEQLALFDAALQTVGVKEKG